MAYCRFVVGSLSDNWKLLRVGFGVTLLGVLILYFDPRNIALALLGLNILWVIIATVLIICATLIGATNAYLLINLENSLTFAAFLPLFWLSWAVGLVFPGQVGDMVSMAAQLRQYGIQLSESLGRSLADKLISLILMVGFASWEATNLPPFLLPLEWIVGIFVFVLLGIWPVRRILFWLSAAQGKATAFVSTTMREVRKVIALYPRRIAVNIFLTVIKIGLTGMSYWFVFRALGYYEIDPWRVTTLVAISSLVAYIPISFNGIGTVEIAGVALFGALGLNQADVLAAYLLLRSIVMLIAWLPAGLWLLFAPQR